MKWMEAIAMELSSGGLTDALVLGLLLGLRHAMDADHVVAVSTISTTERSPFSGIWIGVSWGLGHTTPLLILGILILIFKEVVILRYESIAPILEFLVGAMLVVLGAQVFWKLRRKSLHVHEHGAADVPHLHVHSHSPASESAGDPHASHKQRSTTKPFFRLKSYFVGTVHGLAGTAAIMLILLPQVPSFLNGLLYLFMFGIGTVISMAIITLALGAPLSSTSHFGRARHWIPQLAGAISLSLGIILMTDIAAGTNLLAFMSF
jgi:sulfite exporter TauE/SafE